MIENTPVDCLADDTPRPATPEETTASEPGRCACGRELRAAWMVICTTCAQRVRLTAIVCSSDDPAINAAYDPGAPWQA